MKKMIPIILCCLLIFNVSYAEELIYNNPHVFPYSKNELWPKTILMLQSGGWIIREMDKENGFITTDWRVWGDLFGKHFSQFMIGETTLMKYTISMIPVDEKSTSVQVKFIIGTQNQFGRIETLSYAQGDNQRKAEQEFFTTLDTEMLGQSKIWIGLGFKYIKKKDRLKIVKIFPKSSAKKAKIRSGSILLDINGHNITNMKDLQKAILEINPGDTFTVTVSKGKKIKTFDVIAEARK